MIGDIITILSDGQDTIKREKEANDTSYAHFLEKRNRNRESINLVSIDNYVHIMLIKLGIKHNSVFQNVIEFYWVFFAV